MQFHIPQFIDIEDKIFGPLTFKQFVYVGGAAGAAFLFISILPLPIAIFVVAGIGGLAFMLAFKPIHGRPFSSVLESAFKYFFSSKLYLWKKREKKAAKTYKTEFKSPELSQKKIPRVIPGKLEDLSWNLDVQQNNGNKS